VTLSFAILEGTGPVLTTGAHHQEQWLRLHQVSHERSVVEQSSLLSVIMGSRELRYALSRVDNLSEDFWVHGLKLSRGSSKVVLQR
jgi:ABC-type molybdate transport system ATPase subunit